MPIRCVLRWYLRRARDAYLAEGAATSDVAEILAATAAGARTVEAFGLARRRVAASRRALEVSRRTRFRTLRLRTVFFPVVEVSYVLPVAAVLLIGGVLAARGALSVGAVVAAALYFQQLTGPLDEILMRVEQLQSSGASYARVEGLARVPRTPSQAGAPRTPSQPGAPRTPSQAGAPETAAEAGPPVPAGDRIDVTGARYAYEGGAEVLRGVDLTVRPGERLALVGPSGAGKTTLSRLLAGVDAPTAGAVTVGGVPVAALSPSGCAARSSWSPRSTTSSWARSATTCASPNRPPPTSACGRHWPRSAPTAGCGSCPRGWTRSWARAARAPAARDRTVRGPSSSPWPGWCWRTRTP